MGTQSVGIREFRENLSSYLLESEGPVAITRHGDTIGYFLPTRRRRTSEEVRSLEDAATRLGESIAAVGVTEDDILEEYKRLRKEERSQKAGVL